MLIKISGSNTGLIRNYLGKVGTVKEVRKIKDRRYYVVNFPPIEFLDFLLDEGDLRKVE